MQSVKILKERQMPPHWMFAFDDFLKTTIKHSIEYLTPELRSDDSIDGETTPQGQHTTASLINGSVSATEILEGAAVTKFRKVCRLNSCLLIS